MIHQSFKKNIFPILLLSIIAIIQFLTFSLPVNPAMFGVYPLKYEGFIGVFTAPLFHANFSHFISNFISLSIVLFILFRIYYSISYLVFIISYIVPGIITWFIGRDSYHIGASGLIFSLISFLFFIGFLTKKKEQLAISFIILILNSGFIWGIFPSQKGISLEYHLGGFICGAAMAYFFKDFLFIDKSPNETKQYSNQSSTASGVEYNYEL